MTGPASLFISHGAPDLVLHDTAAKRFLATAATTTGRPKGIVMASAHFETDRPTVVFDEAPEMIYDFGGFDPKLREIVYPAPGSAALAARVSRLLDDAHLTHDRLEKRGFDHGVWVPLSLIYPDAAIPVVQISVQPARDAAHHFDVGRALMSLADDDVLVIGSGALTHNLGALFSQNGILHRRDSDEVEWARAFADWVADKVAEGDVDNLVAYRQNAPFAVENHPTEEHLLPLFVALGAAGGREGERLHRSTEFAILAMDAFAFR